MLFDPVVANPGRLKILTALAVDDHQEFVRLRQKTRLTDGNLSTHARRLASAGLVVIDKSIQGGKPVTRIGLTAQGRLALESHARELLAAIGMPPALPAADEPAPAIEAAEPAAPTPAPEASAPVEPPARESVSVDVYVTTTDDTPHHAREELVS